MAESHMFGASAARLLEQRGLTADGVAIAADIAESELRAVLEGAAPSPSLLRRLAPALGLRAADLFVLADLEVPPDLASSGVRVGSTLDHVVRGALRLTSAQRQSLQQFVKTMDAADSPPPVPVHDKFSGGGAGAFVVRMLRNRNLDTLNAAKMVYRLAEIGPLSQATINSVGLGKADMNDDLLSGFATILGIPVEDLATLIGRQAPRRRPPVDIAKKEIASLLWEMRRLSPSQVQSVLDEVKALADAGSKGDSGDLGEVAKSE